MFNFLPFEGSDGQVYTSYLTLLDFDNISNNDPFVDKIEDGKTDEEKQNALIAGSKFIDQNFIFKGTKYSETQALEFPRDYEEGLEINFDIKTAVAYISSLIISGKTEDLFISTTEKIKSEKYDALSVTYQESKNETILDYNPYLNNLLGVYIYNPKGLTFFNLER